MKYPIVQTIYFAWLLGFLCMYSTAWASGKRSFIDLSNQVFDEKNLVKLNGQWEFYWQKFLEPGMEPDIEPVMVNVPDSWERYKIDNKTAFTQKGHATFRSTIKLPEHRPERLALKIRRVKTSYRLYIDGVLTWSVGNPGENYATTEHAHFPSIIEFTLPKDKDHFVIELYVANYVYIKGGINQSILIGSYEAARAQREYSLFSSAFISGALFLIAIYHIVFWWRRRTDQVSLYFGLFCLGVSARMITTGEKFVLYLFPQLSSIKLISYEILIAIYTLTMLHSFTKEMFPQEFKATDFCHRIFSKLGFSSLNFVYVSWLILVIFVLVVIFAPIHIHGHFLVPYEIYVFFMFMHILALSCKALFLKRESSVLFFISIVALFFACVHDILYERNYINTDYFFHAGVVVFIFSQSIMLSRRVANAFSELEDFKVTLKRKVLQRTQELQTLTEENRRLSQSVTALLEEERKYIAKEMHDGVNGYIVGAKLKLQSLLGKLNTSRTSIDVIKSDLDALIDRLEDIYQKSRAVVRRLRPEVFDTLGLQKTMENLLDEYTDSVSNVHIAYNVEAGVNRASEKSGLAVYRILQEAMTNIIKHAQATEVDVVVKVEREQINMDIMDNGIGINANSSKGVGLISMRERALYLGGEFDIQRADWGGTVLSVNIPIT